MARLPTAFQPRFEHSNPLPTTVPTPMPTASNRLPTACLPTPYNPRGLEAPLRGAPTDSKQPAEPASETGQRATSAPDQTRSLANVRPIRCPRCSHSGAASRNLKTTVVLTCSSCKVKVQLRYCIVGESGSYCRWRPPSAAATAKGTAAREIIARYGDVTDDGDSLASLWQGG